MLEDGVKKIISKCEELKSDELFHELDDAFIARINGLQKGFLRKKKSHSASKGSTNSKQSGGSGGHGPKETVKHINVMSDVPPRFNVEVDGDIIINIEAPEEVSRPMNQKGEVYSPILDRYGDHNSTSRPVGVIKPQRTEEKGELFEVLNLFRSPKRLNTAVTYITRSSLAKHLTEKQTLWTHDIVQRLPRNQLWTTAQWAQWLETTMIIVCEATSARTEPAFKEKRTRRQAMISQIHSMLKHMEREALTSSRLLNGVRQTAGWLSQSGLIDDALELVYSGANDHFRVFGNDAFETWQCMSLLHETSHACGLNETSFSQDF